MEERRGKSMPKSDFCNSHLERVKKKLGIPSRERRARRGVEGSLGGGWEAGEPGELGKTG